MSDSLEVLFISDNNGTQHTACCVDPQIGTVLMNYRGGHGSSKNCLEVIGKDYLVSAEEGKPILHVWPLSSQEPFHDLKMILPGKPSALTVSSDGNYCVIGIDGKIYVWLISTGCLLNVISKHFQTINVIKFTHDSSHFVTAGEDGLVLVWKLADVVSKQWGDIYKFHANQTLPVYHFSQHSLPVTDIFIGHGNLKARLFTISVDQTCKVFCLSRGTLLLSLIFNHVLTSLTVNELETELFVGISSGKILSVNLDPYPRSLECHVSEENIFGYFNGHTDSVTCLSNSLDGVTLASGAKDGKVCLWNIPSRQLIKSFDMKGSISNLFFCSSMQNIFSSKFNPSVVVSKFEKVSNIEEKSLEALVWVHENLNPISFELPLQVKEQKEEYCEKSLKSEENLEAFQQQIFKLREVNKQLYHFAMNKILKNPLSVGLNNGSDLEAQSNLK